MKTKLLKLALCAMALLPMGAWGEAKLIDVNFAELAVETQGNDVQLYSISGVRCHFWYTIRRI